MINIPGIHVFQSVRPEYSEHLLFAQAVSAIQWKMKNGPIHLYTTQKDLEFFKKLGIDLLYDMIDTKVLEKEDDIDWNQFFPASKLKVLKEVELPAAFIDTDLILWETLSDSIKLYDITIGHREGLFWRNYPPLEFLGKRKDYVFPSIPELETSLPINVGFFIMNNETLRKSYLDLSFDYMKGNTEPCKEVEWANEGLRLFWKSLFAEQRLLGALVDEKMYTRKQLFPYNYYGDTLSWKPLGEDYHLTQDEVNKLKLPFFHLWGEKSLYEKKEGRMLAISVFYEFLNYFLKSKDQNLINLGMNIAHYALVKSLEHSKYDFYNVQSYLKLLNEDQSNNRSI